MQRDWCLCIEYEIEIFEGTTFKSYFLHAAPVTSVTLIPTSITLISGQEMNLTCITSVSNPQANITWYKSSVDITSQSTSTTEDVGGLARTISSLQGIVTKDDNGKRIYCRGSNTPNQAVTSNVQSINVLCKYTELHLLLTESFHFHFYFTYYIFCGWNSTQIDNTWNNIPA